MLLAKDSYKAAQDRRTLVADKCKTMQALHAFLLTIIGVFLPKAFEFDWTWMRVVFYIAALFLMNAVTLLLVYLAVGEETVVAIDQQKASMAGTVLKRSLVDQYGRCTVATDNRTDYLVDIYKVSRFFFMFAFTLIVILFSIDYFAHTSATDATKLIQQLRSDPQLIALLKGPQGNTGPKGDRGNDGGRGGKGERGQRGDKGDRAVVDMDAIVRHLVNDAQFKKAILTITASNSKPPAPAGTP